MNLPYLAPNAGELFDQAPEDIQDLIAGGEVNNATVVLGKIYKLPVSQYVDLSNIISFIMVGAIKPEDAVRALMDTFGLPEDQAISLAKDMDTSILEKARIQVLGKPATDMVTLTFPEGRSPDELRKEILDTTKRESVFVKPDEKKDAFSALQNPQATQAAKKNVFAPAGSRTQLLEQLQMLDTIPSDDEIAERLKKIQEQIGAMSDKDERALESPIALSEVMSGGEEKVAEPKTMPATYSKAPTQYNVDPYREVVE